MMNVEMSNIGFSKIENGTIYGWFNLKNYRDLRVEFEFKNGNISYSHIVNDMKKINSFSSWLSKEKDIYTTFMLNYLNEIEHFNTIPSFEGKLVVERFIEFQDTKRYILNAQYNGVPNTITFTFCSLTKNYYLSYQVPIPINSDGEYAGVVYIENILEYETIKRMWDPFRDKTKYRLQLLHLLR